MSWDDDGYDFEFVKFDNAEPDECLLYEDIEILHCRAKWETIEAFLNQWNKQSRRMEIAKFNKYRYEDGARFEVSEIPYYLSMGARLFRVLKQFHSDNPRLVNIRIARIGKGFETIYHVKPFKPTIQKNLVKKSKG